MARWIKKSQRILPFLFLVVFAVSLIHLSSPVAHADVDTFVMNKVFYPVGTSGEIECYNATSYTTAHNATSGTTLHSSSFWYVCGQVNTTDTNAYVRRIYLPFDTSEIPAAITNVNMTLEITTIGVWGDDNITIQKGDGTHPHYPLQISDYDQDFYSGNYGQANYTSWAGGTSYNITFTDTSILNTEGYTELCLRTLNDTNYVTPTRNDELEIMSSMMGETVEPKLYVQYETTEFYQYYVFGAFNEDGTDDASGVNVSFYRPTQPTISWLQNGVETNVTCEENHRMVFKFDMGDNYSRIYYVKDRTENIYVIQVGQPVVINYFTVIDYVGVTNAYLESRMDLNGTERVVERWRIDQTTSLMPFTMTFGSTYTMVLVCDQGTYVFGTWTAQASATLGSATEKDYMIDSHTFPTVTPDTYGISVYAQRQNETWIQAYFNDTLADTSWVQINITEDGSSTPVWTENVTSYPTAVNWYEGGVGENYYVTVEISSSTLGDQLWSFNCPSGSHGGTNIWVGIRLLGTFPFDPAEIPAVLIVLVVGAAFSLFSVPLGLLVQWLVAAIEVYLGWLAISWAWICLAGFIVIILAVTELKEREPS